MSKKQRERTKLLEILSEAQSGEQSSGTMLSNIADNSTRWKIGYERVLEFFFVVWYPSFSCIPPTVRSFQLAEDVVLRSILTESGECKGI